MAGKGGKGGGSTQPAFRGGGTLQGMLGQGGGFGGGGGFMDMLRQQFQPQQQPQFAPVPPPMQTPGQQFVPFTGQPLNGGGQEQLAPQFAPPGMPISRQAPPPQFAPTGQPLNTGGMPISRAEPGLPPTQSQPGTTQLGPEAIIQDRFGGGGQQFQPFDGAPITDRFAPASPLGPLVNPRGGRRGLL